MNVLNIALKDIRILLKDRGQVLSLFLLPLIFIFGFTLIYSVADDGAGIPMGMVNLDPGGEAAETLTENLSLVEGIDTTPYEQKEAERLMEDGELDRYLIIPANFSAAVEAGDQTTLVLLTDPDAGEEQTAALRTAVTGVAQALSLQTQLIQAFRQMDAMMAVAPPEYQVFDDHIIESQAESQFVAAQDRPLVLVEERMPATFFGLVGEAGVQTAVPGFIGLFVFLAAQATAQSVYEEKKVGSFRRLLAAPISKFDLLAGKMLMNLVVALCQIVLIFLMATLVFPLLGLDQLKLGDDILGLAVLSVIIALCSTALGVLIAALARTEGQIGGFSTVLLWALGTLGGAFIPTFLMGEMLGTIAKVTPHYWANEAFYGLLLRGKSLIEVLPEAGVLVGFAVVFMAIGLWQFDYD